MTASEPERTSQTTATSPASPSAKAEAGATVGAMLGAFGGDVLPAGARFGRYAIVRLIGSGAMGSVYEATHVDLKKGVALKIIHPSFAAHAEIRARFLREGEAASRIRHDHVVDVTDFGIEGAVPFLVMELLDGESLAARLQRDGALATEELADLMVPVCAGVAAAHDQGVIHRDLKPDNIFLARNRDGAVVPKVVDFGVCKLSDQSAAIDQTASNAVVGSPAYLSPEQFQSSRHATPRADQYALGVVLYQAATGRLPFVGDGLLAIMARILDGRCPRPSELRADLPAALEELIVRAMQPEAAARFDSMLALGAALLPFASARTRTVWSARFAAVAPEREAPVAIERAAMPAPRRHSLPAERDEFIGREPDLAQLALALTRGDRLVTVLGPGGTGKTRLVTRCGWAGLDTWPGGVWFCDLAEARSVDGIAYALARALALRLGVEPITQLGDALASRGRCLVILDNFEQVTRHAEVTVGAWLDHAPAAQFVVTTREVLGLAGEAVLALAPLVRDEAVALFVRRAEAGHRGFAPSADDRVAIAALVDLLDRLPLAIELAATRVRMMAPRTLLARMGKRFELLASSGRRDRQATLRATLDWSWNLLAAAEQAALAQLSVFEGGFTLEAVEAVVAVPDAWAGDLLQGLIDKSLVRQVAERRQRDLLQWQDLSEPGWTGRAERFDLLLSVRAYAAERLIELGGRDATELRHGVHHAALGTDAAIDALDTPGGAERFATLQLEADNLAIACRRAIERGDGVIATATLAAAAEVLHRRGPASLALELARLVIAMRTLTDRQRSRVHGVLGATLRLTGPEAEVRPALESAVTLAQAEGDVRAEGRARAELGRALVMQGLFAAARPHAEAALTLARAQRDRLQEGTALGVLAVVQAEHGDLDASRISFAVALALDRELGNRRLEALHLGNVGFLELNAGRLDAARRPLEAAIALQDEIGDRATAAHARNTLALLLSRHGQPELARRHTEAGIALAREVGSRRVEGLLCGTLAELELRAGDLDAARAALVRGDVLLRSIGHRFALAHVLCRRHACEHRAGDRAAARAALDEAESIARELGIAPQLELGRLLAAARTLAAGA